MINIFKLKERGHQYQEKGLIILKAIINQMNNYRLSTFKNEKINREQLLIDIVNLLNDPSNYETIGDRIIIRSLNKPVGVSKQISLELIDEEGNNIRTFYSILECTNFFNVSKLLIYDRIIKNKSIIYENKNVFVKKR